MVEQTFVISFKLLFTSGLCWFLIESFSGNSKNEIYYQRFSIWQTFMSDNARSVVDAIKGYHQYIPP